MFKGIDRPFGRGVESRLIQSLLINWRLGHFFSSHLKWISSQDQQKTNRRRLIIYKVTLTGQSHFMLIFVLRKVTLRNHTNSVEWMYAIGPKNPMVSLNESDFMELVWPRTFIVRSWCNRVEWLYGVNATVHCTVYSKKISIKWLWSVKVTLKVIKRRLKVFCWSCDGVPLKWNKKNCRASSLPVRIR